MTTYRISEVAARSGFSPSALRYYEGVGLLAPTRTAAGYRVYDEQTLEQLRFVARAKQLGLSLDEIAEMTSLWDGDNCATTAGHFARLVDAKLADTRGRIAELAEFAVELESVGRGLSVASSDEQCSDECVCLATPQQLVAPHSACSHSACSLDPGAQDDRVAQWRGLAGRALRRSRIDGGWRFEFAPGNSIASELARLVLAEQACCPFLTFTITLTHAASLLEVRAPAGGDDLLRAVFDRAA